MLELREEMMRGSIDEETGGGCDFRWSGYGIVRVGSGTVEEEGGKHSAGDNARMCQGR